MTSSAAADSAPFGDGPVALTGSPSRDGGLADDGLAVATGVDGCGGAGDSAGPMLPPCALALAGGTDLSEREGVPTTLPEGDAASAEALAAVERVRVCGGSAEAIGALVAGVEEDLAGVGVTPVREDDAWWRVVGRRTLERVVGRLGEPMSSPSSSEDSN